MKTQQQIEEVHLVTNSGKSAFICENVDRAVIRWRELGRPVGWTVQQVIVIREDITPREIRPVTKKPHLTAVA